MSYNSNTVTDLIIALANQIKSSGSTNEDGRIKAMILTKLQEAELLSLVLMKTDEKSL